MKISIFIEHDAVIRHFVNSESFKDLVKAHDVTFVFPPVGYKRVKTDVSQLPLGASYRHLNVHQTRLMYQRRMFLVDRLRFRPGKHFATLRKLYRLALNEFKGEWSKNVLNYTWYGLPVINTWFKAREIKRLKGIPNEELDNLINELKPDVIVHPCVLEGVFLNDLVEISKRLDVPLVVIMNSWDNPCTKQAMLGQPDWLLVWGEQTKRHALTFMHADPERVVEFGAAQFEIYREPARINRHEFCRIHNIDPSNKILLYAGSSKETDEFEHLLTLEKAIESGLFNQLVVVYRPHPWGNGGKDGKRIIDYPWQHVRIESHMRPYLEQIKKGDLTAWYPSYKDAQDTLSSIDMLMSPLSTIILEAAMMGKPVMCYMADDEKEAQHFQLVAPLAHFEDMLAMPEVVVATGKNELTEGVARLIKNQERPGFQDQLKKACDFFVKPHAEPYSKRLVTFLEQVHSGK
ncbi:MAG: hypothetical protein SGI71_08500 [Verrucomicrobiota bacterium]|nr:hypothetical protein [Verrucomicrobiota bacterium]